MLSDRLTYLVFGVVLIVALVLDLGLLSKKSTTISIKKALLQKAEEMLSEAREYRQKAEKLIAEYESSQVNIEIDGQKYPLSEWVTMKEYCRRFGLKNTMVLNNWINRQVIPSENILNIRQLNNLRLIKAVPYKV